MIDAHQHFWSVARGDYGWMSDDLVPLLRDFGPQDLDPLMREAGIERTILVQAAETEAETDFLLDIAERTEFVAGVVGWLDMHDAKFSARLSHYLARPKWVGLRPMLQEHEPDAIRDPGFLSALAEVARRRVPFDILTFPRHLPAMIEAVERTPGLNAVVDHLSKPDMTSGEIGEWGRNMARLASHPTVHCKISGMPTEAGADWSTDRIRPFVRHVADAFGAERLMFGTDWPVCTLAATHAQVVELSRGLLAEIFGPEEMRMIFETNAARFYGIA